MQTIEFTRNEYPTVGIELELQLIDAETHALSNSIEQVLEQIPEHLSEVVKPELMQCYLEINTDVCRTIGDAGRDLRQKQAELEKLVDPMGIKLFWAATHPFSSWRRQRQRPRRLHSPSRWVRRLPA